MPRDVSSALKTEKNLEQNMPIVLYEINYTGSSWWYFAEYDTNVTFGGQLYTSFPITHEFITENVRGEIDAFRVSISNTSRAIQSYIESYDGFRGKAVKVKVVWSNHLDDADNYIEDEFFIDSVVCDEDAAEFTLTSKLDVLNVKLPIRKYSRNFCGWVFKSTECGYGGGATVCSHTLVRCRELSNELRYGAFPSIPDKVYYGT